MKTVEVIVEHAGKNLSAYIVGAPVITVGNDMKEIEDNMKEAIELYLEDNPNPCAVLSGEFEFKVQDRCADKRIVRHKPCLACRNRKYVRNLKSPR